MRVSTNAKPELLKTLRMSANGIVGAILSRSLILLESQSRPIPEWVDAEYLYRINYGPATAKDVAILMSSHLARHIFAERRSTILLDRRVSQKLEKTLYPNSRSNVTPRSDDGVSQLLGKGRDSAVSSSFYDRSNPKAGILLNTRDFFRHWFYDRNYCSKGLGTTSRAPIAAVVFDMIDLVTYLSKITTSSDPQPVSWFLEDFFRSHPNLRSLAPTQALEHRWPAVCGFLYDLFDIVSGLRVLDSYRRFGHINGFDGVPEEPDWARCILPGADLLVGLPPIDPASVSDGPIEELDAAFICSGPFKMRFTSSLGSHLQLNTVERELLVYWEDNLSERLMVSGRKRSGSSTPGKLRQFEESGHVLVRLAHSDLGSDWIACYTPAAWFWNCKLFSNCCSSVTGESRSVVSENYSVRTRSMNFGHSKIVGKSGNMEQLHRKELLT
jgi:hypothetical protein